MKGVGWRNNGNDRPKKCTHGAWSIEKPRCPRDESAPCAIAPKKARIEIIPLIDVIFFLLATFVLFTLSLDKLKVLEVPMPRGGPPDSDPLTAFVQTVEGGALYWKVGADSAAELISPAELPLRLANYKRSVPVPRVFIRGDGKAKFGTAVWVLDEVRLSGIKQISVETRASPAGL